MSRTLAGLLLLASAVWLAASAAEGQPACSLAGEHLMSWPDTNPVWQFCWLRPQDSSGGSGSGLEIRDVYYNGYLVMKRGHVPILNVEYLPGGCGCYRDWSDQEHDFLADNEIFPGYAEPTTPALTVCDTGGSGGDIGDFSGVAAEKLADRLILTTQTQAGWYRYMMKWRFYLDGRIEPVYGFGAVNASCISYAHRHHAYWRFDFDIDGPANDVVTEGPAPSPGPRPGPRPPIVTLPTEAMRRANRPGIAWSVVDSGTHRGYRIVPGSEVALPADTFSVADFWALKYKANEIDDAGQPGTGCAININGYVNGEGMSADTVVWYRGGALHPGGELDDCHVVGPTLYPVGDWSIPGPH